MDRFSKLKITCCNLWILKKMDIIGENHDYQLDQVKKRINMEHNQLESTKIQTKVLADKMQKAGMNLSTLLEKQNKATSAMRELQKRCHPGFSIAFDNIDIHVKCRDMTLEAQNTDVHWINQIMVENRVSDNCLSTNDKNPSNICHIPNISFFPSIKDHKQQRLNYIILVSRIMVEHFDAFSVFKDVCIWNMLHKYSKAMSKKSTQVNSNLRAASFKGIKCNIQIYVIC